MTSTIQLEQNQNDPAETAGDLESTKGLSNDCYVQSYCILKYDGESNRRDVVSRFGSWCYAG